MDKESLGRYELNNVFVTFSKNEDGTYTYSWGWSGFDASNSMTLTEAEADTKLSTINRLRYVKVTEIPVSEGNGKAAGELLDWIAGITR